MHETTVVFLITAIGQLGLWFLPATVSAETIDGTIIVHRKLTRPKVTVDVSSYDRGPAVPVTRDQPVSSEDNLAQERSRVVVYLESTARTRPAAAVLEQRNRQFLPETLVVPVGSTVSFPNMDPIFHNVFSLAKAKSFDLGNYPKGQTRTVTFTKPGVVFVNCHLHPNMSAAIVVTPGPWGEVAGRDGAFSFDNVPPGTYTAVAWHRAAGFFRQSIEIRPGSHESIRFLIPLEADGTLAAENQPAAPQPGHPGRAESTQARR